MSKLSGHQDWGWQTGVGREGAAWRLACIVDCMLLIGMIIFPCFSSARCSVWHTLCPMTGIEIHKLYVLVHNPSGRGVLLSISLCLGTRLLPSYFHYYQIFQISHQVFAHNTTWQDEKSTLRSCVCKLTPSNSCTLESHLAVHRCQQWVLPPIRGGSSFTPLEWTLPEPDQPSRNSSLINIRRLENSDGELDLRRKTNQSHQSDKVFFFFSFVREKGVFNLASPTDINFANKSPVTARYFVQKWF